MEGAEKCTGGAEKSTVGGGGQRKAHKVGRETHNFWDRQTQRGPCRGGVHLKIE